MESRSRIVAAFAALCFGSYGVSAQGPPLATEVVATGLEDVTFVASPPGEPTRLLAVQQNGVIRVIDDGELQPAPFLDLDELVPDEIFNGLLAIAFHPDYENNGHFYVHHTRGEGALSDRLTIARYTLSGERDLVDVESREEILVLPFEDYPGHHMGGWLGFGQDGYLYVPLGDGLSTGSELGGGFLAQSLDSPWGKVLRIDVDGDDFPEDPTRNYAIPPDNPFVGQGGDEAVWALGLRNPYRACFDAATGDLWIADVGLFDLEEIDFQPATSTGGENYGWSCAEASQCVTDVNCDCEIGNLTEPIFEYDHSLGHAIVGGVVYRGTEIEGLEGTYFYGDWLMGRIWSLRYEAGVVVDAQERTLELDPPGPVSFGRILSICEGPGGEVYISDDSSIYRIIPAISAFGCGVNPPGSLSASGHPAIGESFDVLVDNPLDTQAPGSVAYVLVSEAATSEFPCGLPVPGWGMSGPGMAGELLIDMSMIVNSSDGCPWLGEPATITLSISQDPSLIDREFFLQGVVFDMSLGAQVPVALTEALRVVVRF